MIAIYLLAHLLAFLGLFYGGHLLLTVGLDHFMDEPNFMGATGLLLSMTGAIAMVASFASWFFIWP